MLLVLARVAAPGGLGCVAATLALFLAGPRSLAHAAVEDAAGAAKGSAVRETPAPPGPASGEQLYLAACASCHGADGAGAPAALVGFDVPVPDLTDCNFATREQANDWVGVVHDGGPARAFDPMMPAFGEALELSEIRQVVEHVRTLCRDESWPRGELNLPRAMFTEKAYPEDEAVLTSGIALEGSGELANELTYEKRFGPRLQAEVLVPFGFREAEGSGEWDGGIGDVALGAKGVLAQSLRTGSILSAGAEVFLPTGDAGRGFGKGTTVLEGFLAFGQLLPGVGFVQLQAGAELPLDTDEAEREGFARAVVGRVLRPGGWGRSFAPMVELLGAGELSSSASPTWDLVPQMQVALNTRQNVLASVAVRVPVGGPGERPTQAYVYLLWDWFDGGLLEGW